MPIIRPIADISLGGGGGWTTQAGSSTNVWATIDETTADDTDYAKSPTPSANVTYEADLATAVDPGVSTGHTVRYRYRKQGDATMSLVVKLIQGTTEIASWTHSGISSSFTDGSQTLTATQADAITDYSDLRLRFTANQTANGTERVVADAVLASTNLTNATIDRLDDDPDSPDLDWATATGNNVNTDVRVSFATPVFPLEPGAGVQEFRALVRKNALSGTGTPTARIELWENGALVVAGGETNVTSLIGQVVSFTWNASGRNAANIEAKVVGTASGGSPAARASVDVGAAEWNARTYGRDDVSWAEVEVPAAGSAFTATITDSLGLVDSRSSVAAFARTPTDSLGLTDSRVPVAAYARTSTDALGLTDSRSGGLGRVIIDPLGLTDSLAQATGRVLVDPLGLIDSTAVALVVVKTLTDALGLSDSVPRDLLRQLTNPLGLADSSAGVVGRSVTDSLGLTDSVAGDTSRSLTDPFGLADALVLFTELTVTDALGLVDPLGLSDTVDAGGSRSVTDGFGLTDASLVTLLVQRVVADVLGLADNRAWALTRTTTDPFSLADGQTREVSTAVTDPLGLVDSTAATVARSFTDSLGLTDSRASDLLRVLVDTFGLVDGRLPTFTGALLSRTITDLLGLVDGLRKRLVHVTGDRVCEVEPATDRACAVPAGVSRVAAVVPASARTAAVVAASPRSQPVEPASERHC